MVTVWRTSVDWRSKRPLLTRTTAHFSIIALALLAALVSGVNLYLPRASASLSTAEIAAFKATYLKGEVTPSPQPVQYLAPASITRRFIPHTTIPSRLRAQVITYTVQAGDTIFDIAATFGLSPETVVWSNREALQDAPWLIQLGLELFILPVDGVYHTVMSGETVESIAEKYGVDPAVLYNEWNDLEEGELLREGQQLVVPGGRGEEIVWTPPQPQYAVAGSRYSYGVCSGQTFTGPGATGWFILPTGSSRVSGWYFRDPRNPGHIGIDYACRAGDPIYASENGVVTIAGWNGGYGILAEVSHGNGFTTRYGHLSDIIVGCGESVFQGQLLGYCGSTGYSSGAHLHFEIRYNGVPQNPQNYLP
ncbi:MAG: LysM peptidoglycan-binding domain-containing M23 family metallopeptidase [Anaerolineae bacterium]|nr:LysM peptidoglycan-binding domain-containing M23 family metallopeptidase [Anaerolineae bacterium]